MREPEAEKRLATLVGLSLASVVLLVAVLADPSVGYGQRAETETLAKQAAKVYREAVSQMRVRKYQQAGDLFRQLIKRFGGYENVPGAQLYLASCLLHQKKDDEYLKQIDLVIRTYAGTEIGLLGVCNKMAYYAGRNKTGDFLETLKEASGAGGGRQPVPTYVLSSGLFHYWGSNVYYLRSAYGWSCRDSLIKLCKTPELAEQALGALEGTFKQGPEDLPTNWLWVHVHLLLRAGKEAEAEKVFKEYTDYWGDDVRGRRLWWEYAEHLRNVAKKPEEARKIYETILKRYEGTDTAADAGGYIARKLAEDDKKVNEFLEFAEKFVQRYRLTGAGNSVESMILKKVMSLAPKDPAMAKKAFELLQRDIDQMLPPGKAGRLEAQITLAGNLKDMAKATSLMTEYLSDQMWSGRVYNRAVSFARSYPQLQPAVDIAKRRRQIHEMPTAKQMATTAPDDQPQLRASVEAAKLLEKLKVRIADDQMRFAEEIADEIFGKYTDTAPAVQAVEMMCDYYFRQVMVEPRDKWMERMIMTYPYHPRTEQVLHKRCIADNAAAEYEKLTRNVDLALSRFPTSAHRGAWYQMRLKCYDAAKDVLGKHQWIVKELTWSAMRGNYYHIRDIIRSIPVPEGKSAGEIHTEAYMTWAKKLGQTNIALWCYTQARSSYRSLKLFDKAIAVSRILRTQKINPGTAWGYKFDDIGLLLEQGKHAEAVSQATKRLPTEAKPNFIAHRQVNMSSLGSAFGKLKRTSAARSLAGRLTALYKIPWDREAVDLMLASAYASEEDHYRPSAKAGALLEKVASRRRPADLGHGLMVQAAFHASANKRYAETLTRYMRQIPRAHHLLPGLLNRLGQHYLAQKDRKVFTIQGQLNSGYAASAASDDLNARVKRVRDAARNKR